MCPLAAAILHLAGVHFSFCISAGMVVSTVMGRNLPPYARWPLSFFAMPACIFHPITPPAWSFRLCRQGICLCVPAGCSRFSPRRRAFFILFPRRYGRFDGDGEEFATVYPLAAVVLHHAGGEFASICPLVAAVLRPAGVHFSSRFPTGMVVSAVPAWNLPPYARWPQPFSI